MMPQLRKLVKDFRTIEPMVTTEVRKNAQAAIRAIQQHTADVADVHELNEIISSYRQSR